MELLDRVRQWAENEPNRIAFRNTKGECLTYGQLERRSDCLARKLGRMLPDRSRPVAVLGQKQPAMLCCFLAAMKSGHPYVPLDSTQPEARLEFLLQDSGAGLLLCCEPPGPLLETACKLGPEELSRAMEPERDMQDMPLFPVLGEEIVYLIYTSGSTGNPKGVKVPCRAAEQFCRWADSLSAGLQNRVYLNQASYSFDLSVMDTFSALYSGSAVFSLIKSGTADFHSLFTGLRESGITIWVSTPSFALLCLSDRGFSEELLPQLRQFLFCGETLEIKLAKKLMERFPKAELINTYGPTETTVAVTAVRIGSEQIEKGEPLPVGVPAPACRLQIADEAGSPLPDGAWGEVLIGGEVLSAGYTSQEETEKRFFQMGTGEAGFRTGDRGKLQNGMLHLSGRLDRQIKLHGCRVEPEEAACAIRSLTGIEAAEVTPVFQNGRAVRLCAWVQQEEGGRWDSQTIRRELGKQLPACLIPKEIRFLPQLPLTPNGKADWKKLQEKGGLPPLDQ